MKMLNIYYFQQFPVDKEGLATVNVMLMFTAVIYVIINHVHLIEDQK